MSKKPATALYFTTVVAIEPDLAILGAHLVAEESQPTITRLMMCATNNRWNHIGDMPDIVYAATKKPGGPSNPRGTLCLMGRQGLYREIVSGSPPEETQLPGIDSLYLMDLRYVAGSLYTCGVQNQVLVQKGKQWLKMDRGIFAPFAGRVDRRLESIDGFAPNDLYAVGAGGAIWHWDGANWSSLDSPTNTHLNIVLCASDGQVYIGGAKGVLLRGTMDRGWDDLTDPALAADAIEDMTEFKGDIYITATTSLLRMRKSQLQKLQVPVKGEQSFYAIDSSANFVWCVGGENVLRFDGTTWEQFICPDNT